MKLIQPETMKSKTFWLGAVSVAVGAVLIAKGNTEKGMQTVAAGLAMIFGRDAISKVAK